MARSCLFCGGLPITNEHVWPEWMTAVLQGAFLDPEDVETHTRSPDGSSLRSWTSVGLDIRVRRFCKSLDRSLPVNFRYRSRTYAPPSRVVS